LFNCKKGRCEGRRHVKVFFFAAIWRTFDAFAFICDGFIALGAFNPYLVDFCSSLWVCKLEFWHKTSWLELNFNFVQLNIINNFIFQGVTAREFIDIFFDPRLKMEWDGKF
jgi:hypothetical protein